MKREGKVRCEWIKTQHVFQGTLLKIQFILMVTGKPDEKKEKGGDKTDDKVRKKVDKT